MRELLNTDDPLIASFAPWALAHHQRIDASEVRKAPDPEAGEKVPRFPVSAPGEAGNSADSGVLSLFVESPEAETANAAAGAMLQIHRRNEEQ